MSAAVERQPRLRMGCDGGSVGQKHQRPHVRGVVKGGATVPAVATTPAGRRWAPGVTAAHAAVARLQARPAARQTPPPPPPPPAAPHWPAAREGASTGPTDAPLARRRPDGGARWPGWRWQSARPPSTAKQARSVPPKTPPPPTTPPTNTTLRYDASARWRRRAGARSRTAGHGR